MDNNISDCETQIELGSDYSFNQSTDEKYKNGVLINARNLVIDGKGHCIDAKSDAGIFKINASNVTIKNIILKNANNSAIFIINSTLTTHNVTFEGNFKYNGGAVYGENATFTSVDDTYLDNYATRFGAAIYLKNQSKFFLINGSFKSQRDLIWGLIDLTGTQFRISNTTFRDIKSKYSSVIHSVSSKGVIENCNFTDLYANMTAGAISFDEMRDSVAIDNCTFKNITSNKNAGAVLFIGSDPELEDGPNAVLGNLSIRNSQFINCSSQFGGALMQLNSISTIENCNFTDNLALYSGAGIHMSYVNANLKNINFKNNYVIYPEKYMGGTVLFDKGNLNITYSDFSDNFALTGSAIYLYDSNYAISNSNFRGENKNYIYSVFDGKTAKLDESNKFDGGKNVLNQTDYVSCYEEWGKSIEGYSPIVFDEKMASESYFNLADYGLVTPVRNQGWAGTCWAFGSASALESAFLKATNKKLLWDCPLIDFYI